MAEAVSAMREERMGRLLNHVLLLALVMPALCGIAAIVRSLT